MEPKYPGSRLRANDFRVRGLGMARTTDRALEMRETAAWYLVTVSKEVSANTCFIHHCVAVTGVATGRNKDNCV